MALTADQLADMQGDLGITDSEAVFTDTELQRLYTRAVDSGVDASYELAVALGFRQLMADAAKFNDYTAGESSETKAQVFEHLKDLHKMWAQAAGVVGPDGAVLPFFVTGTIIQDFQEPGESWTDYT